MPIFLLMAVALSAAGRHGPTPRGHKSAARHVSREAAASATAPARLTATLVEHEAQSSAGAPTLLLPAAAPHQATQTLVPLTTVRSTQTGTPLELTLSAAAGHHALMLHIAVRDAEHHNTQAGASLWDGDAVQLMLHAPRPQESLSEVQGEALAPGDLDLVLGLGRRGPEAMMLRRGAQEAAGPYPAPFTVARDDAGGTTTYTLEVPWSLLHTSRETVTTVGVGVQLNDSDRHNNQRHLVWGVSRAGGLRPAQLMPVHIAPLELTTPQLHLREATSFGEWGVPAQLDIVVPTQLAGRHAMTLEVDCPELRRSWPLASHPAHAMRATLELDYAQPGSDMLAKAEPRARATTEKAPRACTASIRDTVAKKTSIRARQSLALSDGAGPLRDVERRLAALRLDGHARLTPHAVRHLRHVITLWQLVRADAAAAATTQPQLTWDLLPLAAALREQLRFVEDRGMMALEQALTTGALPALELIRSSVDGSWQPFVVQLPAQQARDVAPPAVLFLHGKGSPSLTRFMAKALAPDPRDLGGMAWIMPWGRGNASIVGAAESDVCDIVAQLTRERRIDADRLYLLGFSMGATGAFNLAMHSPEAFAAIGLISGGSWEVALGRGLGDNVHGIPFFIWHGRADSVVPPHESERMVAELAAAHVLYEAHFARGEGHTFLPQVREQVLRFFAAHRRGPQTHWRYVSDGPHHRGRSGVYLHHDARLSPYPSVAITRDAAAHRIDILTKGTDGLEVELSEVGAAEAASVEVYLNQVPAYRGPPVHLTLGAGAPRP